MKSIAKKNAYIFVNGCPAIPSSLPVQINAFFYLDNECRHNLFDVNKLGADIVHWNNELYCTCVSGAYIDGLIRMSMHLCTSVHHPERLYELWPSDWTEIPLHLRSLQQPFCVSACKASLFLSSNQHEFLDMKQSFFPSSTMSLLAAQFISQHCDMFSVPGYLLEQLKITGSKMKEFGARDFRNLLCNRFKLHKRSSNRSTSLKQALIDITTSYNQLQGQGQRKGQSKGKRKGNVNSSVPVLQLVFDLLQFAISDFTLNKMPETEVRKLLGCPLLPLAHKNIIGCFGDQVYVNATAKQQMLLSHFQYFTHPKLLQIEEENPFPKLFSSSNFNQLLHLRTWDLPFVSKELSNLFRFSPQMFIQWEYEHEENPEFVQNNKNIQNVKSDESIDEEKQTMIVNVPKNHIPNENTEKKTVDDTGSCANNDNTPSSDLPLPAPKLMFVPHVLSNGTPHPKWIQLFWECVPISDASQGTVKYFGKWPFLPLTNRKLVCVSYAAKISLVKDNPTNEYEIKMQKIQYEMNYPCIDWRFFPVKDQKNLVQKLSNLKTLVSTTLNNISTMKRVLKINDMSIVARENLIECCAETLRQGFSFSDQMKSNLKSLPIFERSIMGDNNNNNIINIEIKINDDDDDDEQESNANDFNKYISLSEVTDDIMMMPAASLSQHSLPKRFLSYVMNNAIVLQYKFPQLHKMIGIEEMEEAHLIQKYIDEYMNHSMHDNGGNNCHNSIHPIIGCFDFQFQMLEYLVKNWNSLSNRNQNLESLLKKTALIPTDNFSNILSTPSCLYDPSIDIFHALFKDDPVFPHSYFLMNQNSTDFAGWLRKLGMNYKIDGPVFVNCCRKLEELSEVLTIDQIEFYESKQQEIAVRAHYPSFVNDTHIIDIAVQLTSILNQNFNDIYSGDIFNQLADIAFLPCFIPQMKLEEKMDESANVSICRPKEAVLSKDKHLAWTIAPVLCVSMPSMGLQHLKLSAPPKPKIVIAHVQKLSKLALDRWSLTLPASVSAIIIFEKIIQYLGLQMKKNAITDELLIEQLRNTAFVPIGSRLLKPNRLFMSMEEDLAPFMFQVPRLFQSYEHLFKILGTTESPTIDDYNSFLLELANETSDYSRTLNINELNAVFKVIRLICLQLGGKQTRQLLVPSELGVLTWSHLCVYNDSVWISSRINRNGMGLQFNIVHSKLPLNICHKLNILPLSKAIIETLDICKRLQMTEHLTTVNNCIIQYLHNNKHLFLMIERIVRHDILDNEYEINNDQNNDHKNKNEMTSFNKLNLPTISCISAKLQSLKIIFCSQLKTKLIFWKTKLDVTGVEYKEMQNNVTFFMKMNKKSNKNILYLLWPITPVNNLPIILAHCISQLLNIHSSQILSAISSIINIPHLQKIFNNNQPTISDLLNDNTHAEHMLDIMGISRIDRTQNGMLRGIPGALLTKDDEQFMQNQPFRKYLKNEIVSIDHPQNSKPNRNLIYAQVVCQQQDSWGVLSKITVKYNEFGDTAVVSSKDIISFRSNLLNNDSASNNNNNRNLNIGIRDIRQSNIITSLTVDKEGSKMESNDNEPEDSSDDVQELMDTMNSLMSRAGLHINKDKEEMMRENLQLRKDLSSIKDENRKFKVENTQFLREVKNVCTSLLCRVCQENPVDRVLDCGHLLCGLCTAQIRHSKCPFCRKQFSNTINFFNPLPTSFITKQHGSQ